jgi:hypothetical protein
MEFSEWSDFIIGFSGFAAFSLGYSEVLASIITDVPGFIVIFSFRKNSTVQFLLYLEQFDNLLYYLKRLKLILVSIFCKWVEEIGKILYHRIVASTFFLL